MNETVKKRLLAAAVALAAGAGGIATQQAANAPKPSPAVVLAWEIGAHYESGGRHIGKPYVDKIGKGQPWTVCHGVTGKEVDPKRYYTPEDCRRLELPKYLAAGTGMARLANAGDLVGACLQMPRWVLGTVNGQKLPQPGLIDRRETTRELCAEWGRTGHFSEGLLAQGARP